MPRPSSVRAGQNLSGQGLIQSFLVESEPCREEEVRLGFVEKSIIVGHPNQKARQLPTVAAFHAGNPNELRQS
jgi:hypothetical protein